MSDQKKIIICSIVITLLVIVCADIGFGYYMRHTKVVDAGYSYVEQTLTGETHYEDWGLGEPVSVLDAKSETRVRRGDEGQRRTLEEGPIRTILIVTSIALAGAGIFACLLCLNFRKLSFPGRVRMIGLYAIYIVIAVLVVLFVYSQFANQTYDGYSGSAINVLII